MMPRNPRRIRPRQSTSCQDALLLTMVVISLACVTTMATLVSAANTPYLRPDDLPMQNRNWVSTGPGMQFLAADHTMKEALADNNHQTMWESAARHLEESVSKNRVPSNDDDIYRLSPFVEGRSDYDEYQQAWRLLGFMIDCDDLTTIMDDDGFSHAYNNYNNNGNGGDNHVRERDRDLGSHDNQGTGEGCRRYVLWAAYVDLDYQGGGIGEYQYWDRFEQEWNEKPCQYTEESRCAKMDCHLEDTHWSLLGVFKHPSFDDWMEQLFKHEGICVWSNKEYNFMADAREAWPEGCVDSGTYATLDDDGTSAPIYYSVKPVEGGGITLGLYTDTKCIDEYVSQGDNDPINVETVIGNILGNPDDYSDDDGNNNRNQDEDGQTSFSTALKYWDRSFDIFKICQPCVAYDVNNYGYNVDDDASRGSSYGTYRYGYDDDYRYQYYKNQYGDNWQEGNDFDCYDDADYTNVNQCMKFMAKTAMKTATFRDLQLADQQGTLADNPYDSLVQSRNRGVLNKKRLRNRNGGGAFVTYFWAFCSVCFFAYALMTFYRIKRANNYITPKVQFQWNPKQPFLLT